jgi:hypothetical protein
MNFFNFNIFNGRQHLEDVRKQREGEKATTEDEEETCVAEEKSST